MTLGTPGQEGAEGEPFRLPTDLAIALNGDIFISDGYGNARVHKYSPAGEHLLSWGEPGDGPGQFNLSHSVRIDKHDRVWICDRENNRIQIFDVEGNYLNQWTGLLQPDTIYFDPDDDVVYWPARMEFGWIRRVIYTSVYSARVKFNFCPPEYNIF